MAKFRGLRNRGRYYYARYPDGTGKMKEECTKCTNQKDALAFLEERHKQVREGKFPSVLHMPNKTFRKFAKEYLSWAQRQKDYRNKRHFVKKLIDEFGNIQLQKFNKLLVDGYQSNLLSDNLKPASVNREIAVFKHMFSMARDWNMIGESLYQQNRRVKQLPVDNNKIRFLNVDECMRLIEACDDHLKPIVITALNTGMRRSEILNLKRLNVNLHSRNIQVENSKNNESRQIPVNNYLYDKLSNLIMRLDIPYIFYNKKSGKPYTEVKRAFASACERAQITDCTFHTLRHTFASHLVMKGIDLTTVKALMGHKDIEMTLRYSHLAPKHKIDSVAKLDEVFGSGQKVGKNEEIENAKIA